MQLLIDTQAILWFQASDDRLSKQAKQLIDDPNNRCYVSIASMWEMAIKVALNKLQIEIGYENLHDYLRASRFDILDINQSHLNKIISLPHHHGDPFDRLIISQAITENLTIISADQHFKAYTVHTLW
ncbi:type II toxin-antitoxin system VapC family toxin [Mucilaginibacter dorajii]|uniref:Type II toxin-antitoxin system VapC family toxin n=1 Tax=Mucilaginibacter dorajii TaxID=692994 RepID=A0ABP7R487_9SPHI|nr:type II toxin-antitoxin system VapC family toxin [Mucilaginibacter dorajii]MCS3737892.1 PIN domain nuclease of toxin-antitoxin system [Mucilaginibacter dorajii]